MKILKPLLLVALLTFGALSIKAQTAPAISASHLKAAEDVIIACDIKSQLTKSYSNVMAAMTASAPEAQKAKFTEVMTAFLAKYMGYDSLKDDLIRIYAEEFTEDELKDLARFYLTPLGKKVNAALPDLQAKGMALGQKKVQEHMAELQADIAAAMKN